MMHDLAMEPTSRDSAIAEKAGRDGRGDGRSARGIALFLTLLTGFSGLVYEVSWEKYLATLLGSHSEATAAVLGLFLGGLAVGYALFGAVSNRIVVAGQADRRPPRLLLVYGCLEATIGAYAFAFPLLFQAVQTLSAAIPHSSGGLGFVFDVGLSALLIGPPAVLMGGTIPMLTQALARGLADATRFHSLVYAFNTVGAFAGALAAGFWLVPSLGLVGVLHAMGLVNLLAGAVFIALGLRGRQPVALPDEPHPSRAVAGFATYASVGLLVGFAMMTLQTVLIRLGAQSLGASQFTFSMVVAVFVLCIALGSFGVSALGRIPHGLLAASLWAIVGMLLLLYLPLQDTPYWAHVLRTRFGVDPATFYLFHLAAFAALLVVIGIPVALSGATLPLIFHALRRETRDLGAVAGRLYSWNTLGSLLGALLSGYALLFWLDLHQVIRLSIIAMSLAAGLVTARELGARRTAAGLTLAAVAGVLLLPAWSPERLSYGLFRNRRAFAYTNEGPAKFAEKHPQAELLFYDDGPTASIAVKQLRGDGGRIDRSIVTNGKSDSALVQDYLTNGFLAVIPALMAERAERSFVVGYGTGVTVGELASFERMREVVVAEISPAVIRAAPLFDYGNLDASHNPKVRIVRGDAYRALLRSEGRFDVIVSEPSNPWVAGVEMLFSREFLEAARDRLTPRGVYTQWLHIYETDAATIAMVLRTYADVFEHVAVWYARGNDLIVLGLRDPELALDLDRLARRVRRPDFAAALSRCGVNGLVELIAHELLPLGVVHAVPMPGSLHTLLHPRLSYVAARAFFAGASGPLPITAGTEAARIGQRNSLVRRYIEAEGGRLSETDRTRLVEETCRHRPEECVTLLAEWSAQVSDSPEREGVIERIRADGIVGGRTPLSLVKPRAALYGALADRGARVDPLAAARNVTQRFYKNYHHAAPFSREMLDELWRRCEADPTLGERCVRARAAIEAELEGAAVEGDSTGRVSG